MWREEQGEGERSDEKGENTPQRNGRAHFKILKRARHQ